MDWVKMHFKMQDLRGLREGKRFRFANFLGGIQRTSMGQQPREPREGFND